MKGCAHRACSPRVIVWSCAFLVVLLSSYFHMELGHFKHLKKGKLRSQPHKWDGFLPNISITLFKNT